MSELRKYGATQSSFYRTAGAGSSDRLSKYRDIISPQRTEINHHRSEAIMSKWKDSSFRGHSGERLARTELMEKTKTKPDDMVSKIQRENSKTRLSEGRSASRTESSIARLDYFYKTSQEKKPVQPRGIGSSDKGSSKKLHSTRQEHPIQSINTLVQSKPRIQITSEKNQELKTPPRVSYRLPISSHTSKEDTSQFSDKILTILGTQQHQLQVILNEMQKVTSIMSGKNSTSGSKMAALSVDDQESELNQGSQNDKESISALNERTKSNNSAFRPKEGHNSSEISHPNLPPSRGSRSRKNLFSTQKGFEEDKLSRADSSPISKASVEDININELSEKELLELKSKIENKLTEKSDGLQRHPSTKSSQKSSDLVLKKIGFPSHLHISKEPAFGSLKPPLYNQFSK